MGEQMGTIFIFLLFFMLTPSPSNAYVAFESLKGGKRASYRAIAGLFTGGAVLALAVSFFWHRGFSLLLAQQGKIALGAGIFLCALAAMMALELRFSKNKSEESDRIRLESGKAEAMAGEKIARAKQSKKIFGHGFWRGWGDWRGWHGFWRGFGCGFLIEITNIKTALFFALLPLIASDSRNLQAVLPILDGARVDQASIVMLMKAIPFSFAQLFALMMFGNSILALGDILVGALAVWVKKTPLFGPYLRLVQWIFVLLLMGFGGQILWNSGIGF